MSTTSPNEFSQPARAERPSSAWPLFALLLVAAAVLIALQWRRPKPPNPLVGLSLPQIDAEGWLNSDRPLALGDLRGQVVLVDFWATTCPTCITDMPQLVDFHRRFRDQGIKIVGLTPEPGADAAHIERLIEKENIAWPIGYGAGFAFEMMGIELTPTYVLYDRSGQSVWGGHSLDGLETAAIAALAKKAEGDTRRSGEGKILK